MNNDLWCIVSVPFLSQSALASVARRKFSGTFSGARVGRLRRMSAYMGLCLCADLMSPCK